MQRRSDVPPVLLGPGGQYRRAYTPRPINWSCIADQLGQLLAVIGVGLVLLGLLII